MYPILNLEYFVVRLDEFSRTCVEMWAQALTYIPRHLGCGCLRAKM
jgi:hypothetical protein